MTETDVRLKDAFLRFVNNDNSGNIQHLNQYSADAHVFVANLIISFASVNHLYPACMFRQCERQIAIDLNEHTTDNIVIPLWTQRRSGYRRKTVGPGLQDLMSSCWSGRLNKVMIDGITYYGGLGMILDRNFKPILMAFKDRSTQIVEIHITPRVFTETEDKLLKIFAKKIIPFTCERTILSRPLKYVISDDVMSHYIQRAVFDDTLTRPLVVKDIFEQNPHFMEMSKCLI